MTQTNHYSVFPQHQNSHLEQYMFLGDPVNVARYDIQKYKQFDQLVEKQQSFFWRPTEVDVSKDRIDFNKLPGHEKHIFSSNLKYQTLLDSIQGRAPSVALLPICSLPELEIWIQSWTHSEIIHSSSYTHIIRNVYNDPSEVFDDILVNKAIEARAKDISKYYDELITLTAIHHLNPSKENATKVKKALYLVMCSINALEAIRFYVSFACSFAFAERGIMEGNAKIIRLICKDESLHLGSTQFILNLWHRGKDDPEMTQIANELREEGRQIFLDAVEQEKQWAAYLFQHGSMIGLSEPILVDYIEYISNQRMAALGYEKPFKEKSNPLPWMTKYLSTETLQIANQEGENASYLTNQTDVKVNVSQLGDIGDI